MEKKQIVSIIVLVFLLLIATIGISFSYFSATFQNGETTTTITLKGGIMEIDYFDKHNIITINNAFPSSTPIASKLFTLTGTNTTDLTMEYYVALVVESNTFSHNALSYKLSSVNTSSSGTTIPSIIAHQGISNGPGVYQLGMGSFVTGSSKVHTYTLEIYWLETTGDQRPDQGKEMRGYVKVNGLNSSNLLKDKVLASYGGISLIETRMQVAPPNFNVNCSQFLEYQDPENWESYATTTFNQTWYLSSTYSFNSSTGQYTLSGTPVTGFDSSHVGWYTTRDANAITARSYIFKVTGYTSGTSGTLIQKSGISLPIYNEACSGVYSTNDNYGISYYFRGGHDYVYNWVEFAGFYWRIIRIDGNGDIRMIYNGPATGSPKPIPSTTGTSTQIAGIHTFNASNNDNAYVGFKYGTVGAATYSATHLQTNPSNAYTQVTNWYTNNIANKGTNITSKINEQAVYCGDRNITTGVGYGAFTTKYAAATRNSTGLRAPSLSCINSMGGLVPTNNDQYVVPVALITADESAFAGGVRNYTANPCNGHWLTTGQLYWTMSPDYMDPYAVMFVVEPSGNLGTGGPYQGTVSGIFGIRPVIALKSNVVSSSGNGSLSSPYIVE